MILILKKTCKDFFRSFLLAFLAVGVPASAQQFLEPFKVIDPEIIDRYKNLYKETVSGDSYNPADGSVLFQVTDISIPGNFDLPVELTRWIPVEDMMTSDLAGWTWNIPFVRGYYVKHHGNGGTVTASEPTAGLAVGKNCDGSYAGVLNVSNRFDGWGYGLYPSSYWDGKLLHIPGKTSEKFLERSGFQSPSHQVTKSNYYVEACIDSNVENEQGMLVRGPDGTKYTFNQIKTYGGEYLGNYPTPLQKYTKLMMVSHIEDRFGNFVNYNYNSNGDLESIVASDGRQINVYYESYVNSIGKTYSRAAYAEANGRRWEYIYSPIENPIYRKNMLSEVKLPDESKWKYDDNIYGVGFKPNSSPSAYGVSEEVMINNQRIQAQCHKTTVSAAAFTTTVLSPTGASTEYKFSNVYQGRAEVNPQFYPRNYQIVGPGSTSGTVQHIRNMSCNISRSLTSKVISGAGLTSQSWTYTYSKNVGTYQANHVLNQVVVGTKSIYTPSYGFPSAVGNTQYFKTTTAIGPDSKTIYYIDRLFQSPTEGDVLAEDHLSKLDNSLLKRVEYTFTKGNFVGDNWYVPGGPFGPTPDSINNNKINYRINKTKNVATQKYSDGDDVFEVEYLDYDNYGFAGKTVEKNNISQNKKYTKNTYLHDGNRWILGLPETVSVSNADSGYTTVSEIVYHNESNTNEYAGLYLPYEYKAYGTWTRRYPEYHDDGNLQRIEYNQLLRNSTGGLVTNKNRYQNLTNYKRGKAQTIQTSKRYSDAEVMSFSRVVNDDGWVTSITDLNGVTAYYDYDDVGRLISVDFPSGWSDTFIEWQESPNSTTKRVGKSCTLTSDRSGCVAGSALLESTAELDALYRIKVVDDYDLLTTTHRYQNFSFNSLHLPVFTSHKSESVSELAGTTNTYDDIGRLKTSSLSSGGTIGYEYLAGNKIRVTDALGNKTTTTYLAYGAPEYSQMLSVVSPESVTTTQSINVFGDVTSITQTGPNKNGSGTVSMTEYRAYDSQHNLCKTVRSDIGVTVTNNNLLGEIQWQAQGVSGGTNTDCVSNSASDKQINFLYDNLGGEWKIDFPNVIVNPAPDLVYTLDNNGNIKTVVSGVVTQTYNYNILGLLEDEHLQVNGRSFFIDYGYNSAGHLSSLTYPDGDKVQFNPNGFGEARQVIRDVRTGRAAFTYASDATYYPNGHVKTFSYGNGLTHETTLNSRMMPENVQDYRVGSKALHYRYTYDDNLKITSITDNVNSSYSITNLAYDGLGRLSSTTGNTGIGASQMKYDGLGNITYYKNKKHTLDYTYDANNRLQSVASSGAIAKPYSSFVYDDRGNVTNNSYRGFDYNRANQMVVSGNNQYVYDGYNRRVMSVEAGKTSYSFYSQSGKLLYSEDSEGGINYVFLGKKLIAKDGFIPQNAAKQHYLPYGSSVEGEINNVGYTGHKFDTSIGLSYMQARYYDPVIGRFYSNDPIGFTGDVETFNRYSYVGNDPVNMVDPTGEFGVAGILIGAGIEAGLQLAANGKITDWKAVGVAGAVGAVTGGVGGRLATQALQGTISTTRAVATTAAAGGAANGVGTVASNAVDGKATTATEAGVAVAGGAAGAGVGAKMATQVASKLDDLAKSSNLGQHIADTTRASYGGGAAEGGASLGEGLGNAAAEAAANIAQKELNEKLK